MTAADPLAHLPYHYRVWATNHQMSSDVALNEWAKAREVRQYLMAMLRDVMEYRLGSEESKWAREFYNNLTSESPFKSTLDTKEMKDRV